MCYQPNILINKFKNQSRFLEIKLNIILMFNLKNIPSTKKLILMKLMFKRKNLNLFSEVFKKRPKLLKSQFKFLEALFINSLLFNLSLIKKKLNWKLWMDLKNTLKRSQEFFPPNLMKLPKYKKKQYLEAPFTNNTL